MGEELTGRGWELDGVGMDCRSTCHPPSLHREAAVSEHGSRCKLSLFLVQSMLSPLQLNQLAYVYLLNTGPRLPFPAVHFPLLV